MIHRTQEWEPSLTLSFTPSAVPCSSPSMKKSLPRSDVPSERPSSSPSMALSSPPSNVPSAGPSVSPSMLESYPQIILGRFHSCALLDDGTLKCLGSNTNGELGIGYASNEELTSIAIDVGTGGVKIIQVALGDYYSCAILDDGVLMCWGLNTNGQLGIGYTSNEELAVIAIDVGTGGEVIQVDLGSAHMCNIG